MMKRYLIVLLAFAAALSLCACGAAPDGAAPVEPPQSGESGLSFALTQQTFEQDYELGDGSSVFHAHYELPRLELRTADGSVYELPTAANVTVPQSAEVSSRDAFNGEMDAALAALREEADEMAASASEYATLLSEQGYETGSQWVSDLRVTASHKTAGDLVSVQATGYFYYGGAHPNTYTRTWNFDLTTGEFLALDDLAAPEGDLEGRSLTDCVYWALSEQVREQELDKAYFDDYDSYLHDFSSFAVLNFTENGLCVTFDTYIIAPYAAGKQVFTVPYHKFYNALNDRGRALLDVPQEELVLADFDTAETLWAWLFMTTPPTGDSPDVAEIDGCTYLSADIPGVSTLQELRALMCRYFDASLVDEWMNAEAPRRYVEIDGRLSVLSADRGSNIMIGDESFAVSLSGSGGVLTQTVYYQDDDPETGMPALTGETEDFTYPFTLVDGHAVFSAFPSPW